MKRLRSVLIAGVLLAAAGITLQGSSHREAPGITKSPKVDGTDFYMFRSYEPGRADYITLLANYVLLALLLRISDNSTPKGPAVEVTEAVGAVG